MPDYYRCGCEHPDYSGEGTYSDYDCPDCDDGSGEYGDDGSPDARAARDAAAYVDALRDYECPIMYSPNLNRETSCEFEATAGIATAADALSLLNRPGARYVVHGDSTCDGEIVFTRLRLDERETAERYGRSLAVLARLRETGDLTVGMRAGHHVHVSARDDDGRGMSPNALVSLYSIYSHCEDLLYRIAAAGWSMHRDESSAGNWAKPIPKLGTVAKTPRNVGNAIGSDKYQGLNVSNYISNIRNCRCGAFTFGDWTQCECPDDRATVEWRLWNAAVSGRKIRTYIAISAVLTDYAANIDPRECAHLPEHPFTNTGSVNEDALSRQLDYLLSRPGFTNRDRDDISWLVSFAPGMGKLGKETETLIGEEPSRTRA